VITALKPKTPAPTDPLDRSHIVLREIAWDTFQALIVDLESQPSHRLTYDDGVLEIWMPLLPHESFKRWLGRIVEIVTEEVDCEIRSLSACTWRRADLRKGVEADECYYIQHEAIVRGRMDLDLAIDPPPDLAIEIDVTSLSLPRLPIYQALGVPEVWRFEADRIQILGLQDEGYEEIKRSIALPMITPEILEHFLQQAQTMGETQWAKSVRQWAQASSGDSA
jgi:Uma2 family endonuclease